MVALRARNKQHRVVEKAGREDVLLQQSDYQDELFGTHSQRSGARRGVEEVRSTMSY